MEGDLDPSELYELDFVAWTEQQAAALRQSSGVSNVLDFPNLAEEIESLGRRDVREVESLIRQIMLHLLKLAAEPNAEACRHWQLEAAVFQRDARAAFSPSMTQKIDVDVDWQDALLLFEQRDMPDKARWIGASDGPSPISLAELTGREFDLAAAVQRVASRLFPPQA